MDCSLKIRRSQFRYALILIIWVLLGATVTCIIPPVATVISPSVGWDAVLYGRVHKTVAIIDMSFVISFIGLVLFMLLLLTIRDLTDSEKNTLFCEVVIVTKVHIVFVFIEIITKYIFRSNIMTNVRDIILGVGVSTSTALEHRGTGYAIYGLTREASHLSTVLFIFLLLLILSKKLKENKIWAICSLVIMALTMSFSTLMYLLVLMVICIITYDRKISKKMLYTMLLFGLLISIGIMLLLNNKYYSMRISGFFEDVSYILSRKTIAINEVTSSKVRMYGIIETFKLFLERPLIGVGLNTAYCHSGIIMVLSNIGIVGFLVWIKFLKEICDEKVKFLSKNNFILLAVIVLPNLLKGGIGMIYSPYIILIVSFVASMQSKQKISYDKEGMMK